MSERPPYPALIYRQSGVLPYRWNGDELAVLLITSRGGKRWVLPKGIVEPGLSAVESARKEAREEAGVDGVAAREPLGSYRYDKWGGTCEVEVFPLRVKRELEDWPESDIRERQWLSVREAADRLNDEGLRRLVESLPSAAAAADAPWPTEELPVPTVRLVHLLRHAKSSWDDPSLDDFDRPLAKRGIRACKVMQRYMRLADIHPDEVACSAARRTRQTLDGVSAVLGDDALVEHDRALYLATPKEMLKRLRRTRPEAASVMLIAHDPGTHALALMLAGSGDAADLARLELKFPTGALATFIYRGTDWSDLDKGSCELHSFVRPRDLE